MSNFPGGLDVFTTKTDGVDKYNAADMNAVQSAAVAIEQATRPVFRVGRATGVVATDWANIVAAQAAAAAALVAGGNPQVSFDACPWSGTTLTPYAIGNHTIVPIAGVSYIGVPPLLKLVIPGAGTEGPGGDFAFIGGTVLLGDGTAAAFAANNAAVGSVAADGTWQLQCIESLNIYGFGFDTFTYGVQIGAQNVLGMANSQVDQLYARNCSQWGFEFKNTTLSEIGVLMTCLCQNGIHIAADFPLATYSPGNSRIGHLFVAIPQDGRDNRQCRGIWIHANTNSGTTDLNELLCGRVQVNAFNVTPLSVTATLTNASANITVPDGTKFAPGMLCQFPNGAAGFFGTRNYVVRTVVSNTITLARTRSDVAVVAGGNDSQTITTSGFASVDIGPTPGGVAGSNWYTSFVTIRQLDTEGSKVGLYIENALSPYIQQGNVPGTYPGVVARNCSTGQFFLLGGPVVDFDGQSGTCVIYGSIADTCNNQKPAGFWWDTVNGRWVASGAGASNGTGLQIGSTATDKLGFWGATPIVRPGAIATPNTQTGSYVQADVASLKTAIDAIRTALTNVGITA